MQSGAGAMGGALRVAAAAAVGTLGVPLPWQARRSTVAAPVPVGDVGASPSSFPACTQVQGFAARYEHLGDDEALAATASFFALALQVGVCVCAHLDGAGPCCERLCSCAVGGGGALPGGMSDGAGVRRLAHIPRLACPPNPPPPPP